MRHPALAYGLEREGAWSIQLEHEAYPIVITLRTSGLGSVTLTK